MKFDRDTVIAMTICLVVLIAWEPFARWMGWMPAAKAPGAVTAPAVIPEQKAAPAAVAGVAAVPAPVAVVVDAPIVTPMPYVKLANKEMTISFDPVSGTVKAITLSEFLNHDKTAPIVLDQTNTASGALSVSDFGKIWKTLEVVQSQVDGQTYTLKRRIADAGGNPFIITQTWTLGDNYVIDTKISISNTSHVALTFDRLLVNGGDLAPWAAVSGDKERSVTHRLDYLTSADVFKDISYDAKDADFFSTPPATVKWAGVSNRYFICLLSSATPYTLYQARQKISVNNVSYDLMTVGAEYNQFSLAPKETKELSFRYYSGPKVISNLEDFAPMANRAMHLAWGPLDYLARFLLWLLVKFDHVFHSYGLSIIALTLLVRVLFWPATAKANASMKKMQLVQPKIQALREKYKDNPQMLNTKTMELYREEKVNPFGGCLPILLQIPVFFALYATLDGAVELRQVSFGWAKDLAAPDTVAVIPLYFYNLPINPLVLAMTGLMVLQQRMTPSMMDPMQQKMMMAMPVVMLIFLYDLPSGLTLYWTVSQIFSIVQLYFQQRANRAAQPAKVKTT